MGQHRPPQRRLEGGPEGGAVVPAFPPVDPKGTAYVFPEEVSQEQGKEIFHDSPVSGCPSEPSGERSVARAASAARQMARGAVSA